MNIGKLGITLFKKCTGCVKPSQLSKCANSALSESPALFCSKAMKNLKGSAVDNPVKTKDSEGVFSYLSSLFKGKTTTDAKTSVRLHHELVIINRFLNGLKSNIKSGKQMLRLSRFKGSVEQMMKETDLEFKTLEPTANDMTLYRAIFNTAKDKNSAEYLALLKRQKSLKPGDKFVMRGYAYSTPHNTNNPYIESPDTSIIYQIEVPKGARISHDGLGEFIFPRYSACEVIDNTLTKKGINIIKSRYILPQG